ncbi:MAG: hypothetical protein LZF86_110468 [Nitrospira sp.]|nr:MAG: hypothetical protein LZF86_110468 [Nitrospira sp.]
MAWPWVAEGAILRGLAQRRVRASDVSRLGPEPVRPVPHEAAWVGLVATGVVLRRQAMETVVSVQPEVSWVGPVAAGVVSGRWGLEPVEVVPLEAS